MATLPAVVKARVALERANNNLTRERSLARRNAGTAESLQNAENDEQAAEAVLADMILSARSTLAAAQAARVAVDLAKDTLSDMKISAPVPSTPPPGVTDPPRYAVAKRSVSEGQMIKEGEAVAELVIDNPLRLWANVPERFSDEVALDQPVRMTVASHPGTTFEGKVARLNPSIDPTTRTFQVEVVGPEQPRPAPAGRVRQGVDPDPALGRRRRGPDRVGRQVRRRHQAVRRRGRQIPLHQRRDRPGGDGLG